MVAQSLRRSGVDPSKVNVVLIPGDDLDIPGAVASSGSVQSEDF